MVCIHDQGIACGHRLERAVGCSNGEIEWHIRAGTIFSNDILVPKSYFVRSLRVGFDFPPLVCSSPLPSS